MQAESREEGFTLVEVAVAMAIFLTVMLAVLAMFNSSHRLFAKSRLLTKATNLATDKMADFRLMDLAAIARVTGESVSTVKELGFLLADSCDDQPDECGPLVIDWDALEACRNGIANRRPIHVPDVA